MILDVLIWIAFGVLAGLIVNFVYPLSPKYLPGTIAAGIVGAIIGGVLFSMLQIGQVAFELDPIATIIAIIGSILLVYFVRAISEIRETDS